MEILIQISAPTYGRQGEFDRRAAQFEQNEIANMIKLLGERIALGQREGTIARDGAALYWKTETPIDKPADNEAA